MIERITPVIIARDAAGTIAKTLGSLAGFSEVIVYENGSRDATARISASFPNTRVVSGDFIGFGPTKNHAAGYAGNDWILSIDADEYLGDDLIASIAALDLGDSTVVYAVERYNLFLGKLVTHGGWGHDWLVRLYNRRHCGLTQAMVHEKVAVPRGSVTVRLDGALWHQAVTDVDQFLQKISRYSELRRGDGAKTHSPAVILWRTSWSFFRSYVLKAGFLEGWRGVVIATGNATGTFFRHMKRYADQATATESSAAARLPPAAEPHAATFGKRLR